MGVVVAIDGTAGSGKGTVAKIVAEKLKFNAIDTGAMYRCVTLTMLRQNVSLDDEEKIKKILEEMKIEFVEEDGNKKVFLNGEDVTLKIRSKEVTDFASPVATIKSVRENLAQIQRDMAKSIDVIMDGRDIGTNVFPNADVKIYLDATPEERAKRRFNQNQDNGIDIPFEEVLKNVKERDYIDTHREIAPLTKATDAIYIDSTEMTIEEVTELVIKLIEEKRK